MEIKKMKDDATLTIELAGRLDTVSAPQLESGISFFCGAARASCLSKGDEPPGTNDYKKCQQYHCGHI